MTPHAITADDDDFAYAHSREGIDRAKRLAVSTFEGFVTSVDIGRLDTTIASTLLVAEALANLQVNADVTPEALIREFRYIIDERVAMLKEEIAGGTCTASKRATESVAALH